MSNAAKNVIPPNANISIYEIIDECSLSIDEEYEYKEFIEELGVEYLYTFFIEGCSFIRGNERKCFLKLVLENAIILQFLKQLQFIKNQ